MKIREPVVVTGADGLLGRHMVNRLLREGVRVRALLLPGQKPDPHWMPRFFSVIYASLKLLSPSCREREPSAIMPPS